MTVPNNRTRGFFIVADLILLGIILILTVLWLVPSVKPGRSLVKAAVRMIVRIQSAVKKVPAMEIPNAASCGQTAVFSFRQPVPLSTGDDGFLLAASFPDMKKTVFASRSGSVVRFDAVRNASTPLAVKSVPPYAGLAVSARMMWLCDTAGTILAIEPTAAAVHPLFTVSSFRTSAGFVPAELDGERGADFLFVDPFNRIVAVSGRDGTPLWNFGDAPDSVLHAPVVVPADGRIPQVVFAAQDGTVIALDGRNGWALWKNPLQSAVKSAVVAADAFGDSRPELFVCSSSRKLFCLALDGRTAWKTDLPSEPEGTVLCADMNRDGAKEIVLSLVDGTVLCLCPTGVTLWTLPGDVPVIPGGLVSASVSKGRKVLVLADANGFLRLIDAANGNLLGSSELPVPPVSALTVRGSKVFFAGRDGQVHEAEILCP